MRGEHALSWSSIIKLGGSSPHARGTRLQPAEFPAMGRFIPACAGNTRSSGEHFVIPAVHPRMRGEHEIGSAELRAEIGSSPHARGTLGSRMAGRRRLRFIPACAGNTTLRAPGLTLCAVHPRMRGEHLDNAQKMTAIDGSSPHARGTHQFPTQHRRFKRFIPACAGNTYSV